ncbi:hypothetical protein AB1L88_15465 [Tautonia sp. JC769]|uniref:hypothetical protein n=1 Tax=Tautonia sp. JC769 TaxID=3232135 RepID=UPI00345899D4
MPYPSDPNLKMLRVKHLRFEYRESWNLGQNAKAAWTMAREYHCRVTVRVTNRVSLTIDPTDDYLVIRRLMGQIRDLDLDG